MLSGTGGRWRLVLAGALAALSLAACSDAPGRVLLIGIDGATFRVARPMMEDGRLPNLAALASEGVRGPLHSVQPLLSPRIWNSIATSRPPSEHGILAFAKKQDEQGARDLYLSTDRKVRALWNIASDAGLRVAVVNWWNTFPPERINGVMVSDHLLPREVKARRNVTKAGEAPHGALVFPEDWQPRILAMLEGGSPPVAFEDPFLGNRELPSWNEPKTLSRHFREDAMLTRLALAIESDLRPDLLMLLLPGIDRVSHFLWGNLESAELYPEGLRPDPSERAAGVAALEAYYAYTDALIGTLVERYGSDDLVMVVSDHGFEASNELMLLTGGHHSKDAIEGVLFARGPGFPVDKGVRGFHIYDVTPMILAWLRLPVAEDMYGRVPPFLDVPRPERIATYDNGAPVERLETGPSGADEELLEQLRALGYFE